MTPAPQLAPEGMLSPAQAARVHPDIFTPEEAVAYLRLESERTLDWLATHFHLNSAVVGSLKRYHRKDLDACAERVFGKVQQTRGLKIAGERR